MTAAHMVRVFTACGWPCEVIGRRSEPDGEICACLWEVNEEMCERLLANPVIESFEYRLDEDGR